MVPFIDSVQDKYNIDINGLYTKPYTQVPFPIGRGQITEAVDAFFKFLQLPEAIKGHIDFKIAPLHRRGDIGYKHRDSVDNMYSDSKDFFHFHPLIFDKYRDFILQNPAVGNFLNLAKPLWQATYDVVHQILGSFESNFPGLRSKVFDTKEPHIVLRFLKYEFVKAEKYLAKPHFDSGSFTLAIAESCPGLRVGTGPYDLELVHHEEHKALFMFSSNYRKLITTHRFFPGWHDVIQTDESQIGKPCARWAVVAFIDGHSVTSLSRSETHKWYQENSQVQVA